MVASFITFKGRKYRLSGRYYKAENWGKGPSSLHRAKWEFYRGPIPENFDIHHVDGNGANNSMANLEMVERGEHRRAHTLELVRIGKLQPPSDLALQRAAIWHASKEGLAWHSRNGKKVWKDREWHLLKCQECGRDYRSPYKNKSKFCHLNCKMAALRRRRGRPVGVRPNSRKTALLSGKRHPGQ